MRFGNPQWNWGPAIEEMTPEGANNLLAWAIEQKEWQVAGLCLLFGMMESIRTVPREVVDAMIDEVAGFEEEAQEIERRQRTRKGRRGRRR
jgi:hypothetical protein